MTRILIVALFAAVLGASALSGQVPAKVAPKLEPVAETKLLMQGMIEPNFTGLGKRLKDPPDAVSWEYIRGQSLLVAEAGNLLMLRPPKARAAQDQWMEKSAALRAAAVKLSAAAVKKDYLEARAATASLANACNRCHEATGTMKRVEPFE